MLTEISFADWCFGVVGAATPLVEGIKYSISGYLHNISDKVGRKNEQDKSGA